jgi:hypothetical protein
MGPRALDVGLAFGGFSRSLDYNQPFSQLRSYKLALGPQISVRAIAYPLAFMTSGFLANLGVELSIDQAFSVTSSVTPGGAFPAGADFNTIIHDYYGGARVRYMLSGGHEIAVFGGGGEHAFSFRDDPTMPNSRSQLSIPDTIYRYARFGVDAKFELPSGVTARVSGAYRSVLNQGGQIASSYDPTTMATGFFPYLTVGGVDFSAELGYHITPSWEARLGVSLKRYFFAMNSAKDDVMADPNTGKFSDLCPCLAAGGAVDQYVGFSVGAAYVFGGVSPGASPAADEQPAPAPKKKKHKKKGGDEDDAAAARGVAGGAGDQGGGDSDE